MSDLKTRYSDDELQEFKTLIEGKLAEEQALLDNSLTQLQDMADNPDNKTRGLDDSYGTTENQRLLNLAARQKKHIQYLQNALLRIENKVYGICRESGKLISKERLRAVPHATLSIAAKQKK